MGYRYSTLPALPDPHYPGYTPPLPHHARSQHCRGQQLRHAKYMVVGLISVGQLTLGEHFSDIRGMTEVYNLFRIGDR